MNIITVVFNMFSINSKELRRAFARAVGRPSGVGFRKNKKTVATARMLLLAYAAAHRARRDTAFFSGLRM